MIRNNIKVHFIGIGGIGMSGIAESLLSMGFKVSGSDLQNSPSLEYLKSKGAEVYVGHMAENVRQVDIVTYSSAIDEKNPEIKYALDNHIPTMRRAEILGHLMRLKKGIAIAGTHGKTTTTSLVSTIFQESNYDPTYIIGGVAKNLGSNAKVGKGEFLIAEADESDGTFLMLNPIMSAITNIDLDHMDFYKEESQLKNAFIDFANKIPFYGCVVLNGEDKYYPILAQNLKRPHVTFGIGSKNSKLDYQAGNIKYETSSTSFDIIYKNSTEGRIKVNLLGQHNVYNTLCATAVAHEAGINFADIVKSLTKFDGVARRLQIVYDKDLCKFFEDYAHHPTEIEATISALRNADPKSNITVIFQPHRYTRTKFCWNDFVKCFSVANKVYMLPIYAASERKIEGIESEALVNDINKLNPKLSTFINSGELAETVKNLKNLNGNVIIMGAGDIGKKVKELL